MMGNVSHLAKKLSMKAYNTTLISLNVNLLLRYEIMKRGFNSKSITYGMKIYFVNEVHVTTSHLTIEPLALMSRIGGIIGVGRALAWVILLCFDKIAILYAFKKDAN